MLAFVSFWIPAAAHPARVALVVTNFLASCVIYRGADSNTPPTGDLNPLEKYLMMDMIVMMLVMMEYLLVNSLIVLNRGKRTEQGILLVYGRSACNWIFMLDGFSLVAMH